MNRSHQPRGRELRRVRISKGLSQLDLQRESGVPQSRISNAERECGEMTTQNLLKLAGALDVPIDQIAVISLDGTKSHERLNSARLEVLRLLFENPTQNLDCRERIETELGTDQQSAYMNLSKDEADGLWLDLSGQGWVVPIDGKRVPCTPPAQTHFHMINMMDRVLDHIHAANLHDAPIQVSPRRELSETIALLSERVEYAENALQQCTSGDFSDAVLSCDLAFVAGDPLVGRVLNELSQSIAITDLVFLVFEKRIPSALERQIRFRRLLVESRRECLEVYREIEVGSFSIDRVGIWTETRATLLLRGLSMIFGPFQKNKTFYVNRKMDFQKLKEGVFHTESLNSLLDEIAVFPYE
ncbi:helix-turn-helix domain-containing protein [Stieleria tagensis]|uniref:helix-turn-helix domain-containing protein n=1 Tax=Stieleria tagensis TaxID=2956795 RepID=UPI0021BCE4D9|nr:helix-turn-helix transcriptional regulator [Stieleria tagensis]